jgi:hypothetical protein
MLWWKNIIILTNHTAYKQIHNSICVLRSKLKNKNNKERLNEEIW